MVQKRLAFALLTCMYVHMYVQAHFRTWLFKQVYIQSTTELSRDKAYRRFHWAASLSFHLCTTRVRAVGLAVHDDGDDPSSSHRLHNCTEQFAVGNESFQLWSLYKSCRYQAIDLLWIFPRLQPYQPDTYLIVLLEWGSDFLSGHLVFDSAGLTTVQF